MKINSWKQAVSIMANGTDINNVAAAFITNQLRYPGEDDPQISGSVFDWVINGDWRGNEKREDIQAELIETFEMHNAG